MRSLGLDVSALDVDERLGVELERRLGGAATVARVERSAASVSAERPLLRRLRKAGVDPDAGVPIHSRKPEWLRIEAHMGEEYQSLRTLTEDLRLVTVCEEAGCPNIFECWSAGTATFMVNGERCTRACGFCLIDTRKPFALDPSEPERVAEAVVRLKLAHAVITCVARDDSPTGSRGDRRDDPRHSRALTRDKRRGPHERPQGRRRVVAIDHRRGAGRVNHNVETVARLQRAVRPSAGYLRSLTVLARSVRAGLTTKSGLMVGLGESADEVEEVLADMAAVGVSIATIGQYLRPTAEHLPVARWWEPQEFDDLAERGRRLGLKHVQSSPLTRSSYHAREALSDATPVAAPSRR